MYCVVMCAVVVYIKDQEVAMWAKEFDGKDISAWDFYLSVCVGTYISVDQ